MRILQVHKYFTKKRGGGSVSAFFETKKILEERDEDVLIFSMHDPENYKTRCSKYFISHFDINEAKNFWQKIKFAFKSIHNREAQKKIGELILAEKPDVAHIHNIYHYLTPSILHTLKKHGVPIVFKLSDYKLICPNYKLFVKGEVCQRCKGGKFYHCFLNKCLKESRAVSFVAMMEAYIHHKIFRSYSKVDLFLAPSEFMKKKCVEFGIEEGKIRVLRNVLNFESYQPDYDKKNFFLYSGRLSSEKGVLNLVEAIGILKKRKHLKGYKLVIIGQGPQEKELQKRIKELDLEKEVEMAGFQPKWSSRWLELNKKAELNILPSIWFDNSPVSISEAMAFGVIPLVSDRGGTKEMVEDGKSGIVYDAESVEELAEEIKKVIDKEYDLEKMQKEAAKRVHEINNEDSYYKKLGAIYQEVQSKVQSKKQK